MVLCCLPGASQAVQLVLSCFPGGSLVPPRLSHESFPASLVPPRLSNSSFPASQAVPLVLSCLPGASQPVQLVLSCLPHPPCCLADFPISPFLLPWCLPGCPNDPCLPPCHIPAGRCRAELWPPSASRPVQMVFFNGAWLSPGQAKSNLAFADYWSQLVLPWQITGVSWSCLGRLLE